MEEHLGKDSVKQGRSSHVSQNGYHQKNPQAINARESVETREPFYTAWGECKLVQPLWRTVWRVKKL